MSEVMQVMKVNGFDRESEEGNPPAVDKPEKTASSKLTTGAKANGYKVAKSNGHKAVSADGHKVAKAKAAKAKANKSSSNGHKSETVKDGLWAQVAEEFGRLDAPAITETEPSVEIDDFEDEEIELLDESEEVVTPRLSTNSPDDQVSDDEAEDEDATSKSKSLSDFFARNYLPVLLGVVAIGLAIALILTTSSLSSKTSLENSRTTALAAAKTYAADMGGYNFQSLSHDFAVVEANSTPTFARTFSQAGDALKTTLTKYRAAALAKVVSAGVVSATNNSVTVLVFLNQTVTNSLQKNSTTTPTQLEITVVNSGGKWLINNATLL